jgi:hypothetical protein
MASTRPSAAAVTERDDWFSGARVDDDAADCRAGGDLRDGRCGRQNHDGDSNS